MSSTLPCWSTAPQVPLCAVELDEHLIQVPFVAWPPTTTAQLVRVLLPEPLAPGPDRLIGHVDTTFEHQLLHVAEAQREPVVQPDAMADDLGRKPEPLDTTSLQRSRSSTLPHLTFPAHQPDNAVLVETLLDRRADGDVAEAETVVEQLAAAPADDRLVIRDIWLLRLRALLAQAHSDEAAYPDYRDRYRNMARTLGFEGHIAWAEEMP